MMNYEKTIFNLVLACSEAGKKLMQQYAMMGDMSPLFLHFKESIDTHDGELILLKDSESKPEGFKLVPIESLKCDVPYASYFHWVHVRITSLPILATVPYEIA